LEGRIIVPFTAVIGSKWKDRGKRAFRAALTIVLLSAFAVVGMSLLGSEVLAAWRAPGNAEQKFVSTGALEGLFSFDAPASTVARFEAATEQDAKLMSRDFSGPSLFKNWTFTASQQQQLAGLTLYNTIVLNTIQYQTDLNFLALIISDPTPFVFLLPLLQADGQAITALANTLIQDISGATGLNLKQFSPFMLITSTTTAPTASNTI
jgi:hypothetical protein